VPPADISAHTPDADRPAPPAGARARSADSGLTSSQRRRWTRRASSWDREAPANTGLASVVAAVVEDARVAAGTRVADLGCGTGQVTLPLARAAASVVAVDISEAMITMLRDNAAREGIRNVDGMVAPLERLTLPAGSVDVLVSNYALHHLADAEKRRLVERAVTWLAPGGRIVIGDMMFGRGADAEDRAVIREKAAALVRKGPGGLWRLAKGAWRFGVRTSERPLPPAAWVDLLEGAGFRDVTARKVVSEAWVVSGTAPPAAAG
jgi:ubiquinone/menaquinone biosynthesis C-methylase UbiE